MPAAVRVPALASPPAARPCWRVPRCGKSERVWAGSMARCKMGIITHSAAHVTRHTHATYHYMSNLSLLDCPVTSQARDTWGRVPRGPGILMISFARGREDPRPLVVTRFRGTLLNRGHARHKRGHTLFWWYLQAGYDAMVNKAGAWAGVSWQPELTAQLRGLQTYTHRCVPNLVFLTCTWLLFVCRTVRDAEYAPWHADTVLESFNAQRRHDGDCQAGPSGSSPRTNNNVSSVASAPGRRGHYFAQGPLALSANAGSEPGATGCWQCRRNRGTVCHTPLLHV